MKKKILFTLMVIVLSIFAFGALSVSAETSGHYTYTVSDGQATITNCDRTISGYVTIPSTLGGYPVTTIGHDVFYNCPNLTGLVIPDTVVSIDTNSILGCENLKSITIGKNLAEVEDNVFCNLYALETINWNAKNLTYLIDRYDDNYVFDGAGKNGNGVTIIFGDSVETIPEDAFIPEDEEPKIAKIIMGKNIQEIGASAFPTNESYRVYIDSLENYLDINFANAASYPTNGANQLYVNNTLLTEMNIPNGVTKISEGLMRYNTSITKVNIPNSVTSIDACAFSNCTQLQIINVSSDNHNYSSVDGVLFNKTKTELIALSNRGNLTEYTIPAGVNTIKSYAFENCTLLKTIIMPDSMKSIEKYAFLYCSKLSEVYFQGTKTQYSAINTGAWYENSEINNATKIYLLIDVKMYDMNNELLLATIQEKDTVIDLSSIIEDGYICNIYTDIKKENRYAIDTPITKDITLYVDLDTSIKSNSLNLFNHQSVTVGQNDIIQPVSFATDKDASILYCFIRYPDSLTLKLITAKDFAYVEKEDEYTEDGYTTAVILAQYSDTELIPANVICTPFELAFDVEKTATPGEAQIEATEESCLIGNDIYFFADRIACNLEILPKLAQSIEIAGADTISSATAYTVTVYPDYTTNKEVAWSVDDEKIAAVDETGVVTPVTSGTVVLTATTKDGSGVLATKIITITRGVTGIEIAGAHSITEATQYTAMITPDYATNKEVEWSINDESIATIDQNGMVTPVTSGLVVVTATAKDGSGVFATKAINIIKLADSIEIAGEDSISSPSQYAATVFPDYTSNKDVEWSVDNEEIAMVDETGVVTPVTSGTIVLTATVKDGSGTFASKTVEIIKYAESIEIVGEEEISKPSQYSVVILPDYTTNKNANWSVSDESVATVDANGLVTPLKNGKIVLTATAEDGSGVTTTKSIVITVSVRVNSILSDIGTWDKDFDSDITEYVIYVNQDAESIYLTSSFKDATAKVNGSLAASGMRKKVTLTGPKTTVEIVLTPISGNELKANTYTITVNRGSFTETTVAEDGKAFTVAPVNIEEGTTVILALYDGGKLVETQTAIYRGEEIPFTTTQVYTNAKVMAWDLLTGLQPVCNTEIVK